MRRSRGRESTCGRWLCPATSRLLLPLLLLLPCFATLRASAEAGGSGISKASVLFSVDVKIDDEVVTVPVHEGESPADVARTVGSRRGLAREGVTSLTQMLTRKALEVLGPSAIKRVFFQLPVRVELAPGGETKGVQLTVYEESDPEKVSKLFARRYGLPAAAAQRLQLEIVRQMELRTRLRVEVNLPGGGGRGGGGEGAPATRLLTVRTGESTEQAARRFGLEHGLTAQGIDALWGHLDRQLARRGGAQEPATSSQVSGSSSGGSEAVMAATAEPGPGAASTGGGRSPQDVLVGIT